MPYIALAEDLPGIRGLLAFKPATGQAIAQLIQEVLRGPSPLSAAERERIAEHVSRVNECEFCARSHGAAARHLDGDPGPAGGAAAAWEAGAGLEAAAGSPAAAHDVKLAGLLALAGAVARGGHEVTDAHVAAARTAGASDEEIHDTVLVAAAFAMLNRYVDGLGAITPHSEAAYDAMGRNMAANGYLGAAPSRAGAVGTDDPSTVRIDPRSS